MSQYWHTVTIAAPTSALELINHRLFELGTLGTIEDDMGVAPDQTRIKAYFSSDTYTLSQLQSLIGFTLEGSPETSAETCYPTFEITTLTFNDWADNWKQFFLPFHIADNILVSPTWEAPSLSKEDILISLDPGMAFGTGLHATTQLTAKKIVGELKRNSQATLLDVGCGSGILSIIAAKLSKEKVVAVDIDTMALKATKENAHLNSVADFIELERELKNVGSKFDIIAANILLNTLKQLKPLLLERLNDGGLLILSGVLIEQEEALLESFESDLISCIHKDYQDEWACYTFT